MTKILRIALDTPLRQLFDYRMPAAAGPEAPQPGARIRVPFGRRRLVGILIESASRSDLPMQKLKTALEVRHKTGNPLALVADGKLIGVIGDDEIYRGILRQTAIAESPAPGRDPRGDA